jgi:hypothetical protein
MAYLDAIMGPEEQEQDAARNPFPWMKPLQPVPQPPLQAAQNPPTLPAPPIVTNQTQSDVPAAPAAPVALGPTAKAAKPMAPPTAPVTLGAQPAAGSEMPAIPTTMPAAPITLGPQAQPSLPGPPARAVPTKLQRLGAALSGFSGGVRGSPNEGSDQIEAIENKPIAQYDRQIAEMEKNDKFKADQEHTAAETRAQNADADAKLNPKSKTKPIVIVDEDGNPHPAVQDEETGAVRDANGLPVERPKMWEKPAAVKTDKLSEPEQAIQDEIAANPLTYPGGNIASNRAKARLALKTAEANAGRGPKNNDARNDRSYTFNAKELDNERKPLEATMAKISSATSNIDLKNPQADALLAPQILSLAAGGPGSGLRMNEAEISRILGGRTEWESLKAATNRWSTDPSHPAIPEAQRAQMIQILQAAQGKGVEKNEVLQWADSALIDADDPTTHRQIVAQARKFLNAIDEGHHIQKNRTTGEIRIKPEVQPAK